MVAASAVSGSLRLGVPVDGRVGINPLKTDAGLIVSLDVVIRVDIDMGGSLSGLSPYEVGVPVFDQGNAEMVESTLIREISVDSNSSGLLNQVVPSELEML